MLLLHQCRETGRWSGYRAPPLRIFNPPLICLSHPSVWNLVPRRGVAPRSPAYRAGALLLSYGGIESGSAVSAAIADAVQRTAPHS